MVCIWGNCAHSLHYVLRDVSIVYPSGKHLASGTYCKHRNIYSGVASCGPSQTGLFAKGIKNLSCHVVVCSNLFLFEVGHRVIQNLKVIYITFLVTQCQASCLVICSHNYKSLVWMLLVELVCNFDGFVHIDGLKDGPYRIIHVSGPVYLSTFAHHEETLALRGVEEIYR